MSYGLGSVLKGAGEAVSQEVVDRRADEKYNMGLEEAEHLRNRRKVTEGREDEQYELEKEHQVFNEGFTNGMRDFGVSGKTTGMQELYNSSWKNGINMEIVDPTTAKGKYKVSFTDEETGEPVGEAEEMDKDSLGSLFMNLKDPTNWIKMKQESNASALEHKRKLEIEGVKHKGKANTASLNNDKFFNSLAKDKYGKFDGMNWSFDNDHDKVTRLSSVAGAFYRTDDYADRNAAADAAAQRLDKLGNKALEKAKSEVDNADIGDMTEEEWVNQRAKSYLDNAVKTIVGIGGKSKKKAAPKAAPAHKTGEEYLNLLKKQFPDASEKQLDESVKAKYPDWQAKVVDTASDKPEPNQATLADATTAPEEKEDLDPTNKNPRQRAIGDAIAKSKSKNATDEKLASLASSVPPLPKHASKGQLKKAAKKQTKINNQVLSALSGKNINTVSRENVKKALSSKSFVASLSAKQKQTILQYLGESDDAGSMLAQAGKSS